MHDFLEMTDQREHRQEGFDEHPGVPFAAFAQSEIGGLPSLFLKVNIAENNHLVSYSIDQCLESRAIIDVGCIASPIDNQAKMVEQQAQFAANNPTTVGTPFAPIC